ncbi:MAG TPA: Ig-like domain-containing protein, partial [Geobacteraceae bacterium]|nr:Ig-like domain-containing protein [Geobacteraceae bacterium]
MFRLICSGLAIVLMLSGCSSDETPTRHNDFIPLTSIEIVAVAPSIAAHTSTKLTAIGNFSGQFTRDVTDQAVWSSNSPAVAEFITPGSPSRVTGHVPGTAVLTATVGSVSAPFSLTVTSATVTAMTIAPPAPTVPQGLSTQLTASGTFSDTTTQDLTFDATWASSAPDIAAISNAVGSNGLAKALAPGTSTITATFGGASATALMTVTEVVLQSITVTPTDPSILSLSTGSFHATGHFSDGSTADVTAQAAWTSSQPGIATIAPGGAATTLVPGTTTISAALNGVSGTSSLKVTGGRLTGIVLSPVNPRLVVGTAVPITATGSFSNGSSRDITGAVNWSVASPTIANVTTPGGNVAFLNALAVPVAPVRVTATSGTVTADTNLTVAAPALQSLLPISPPSLDLSVGTSGRLTATAMFTDGTTQDVTVSTNWTSNAILTASIDNTGFAKGRVHGISPAAGPVTVTAAFGALTVTSTVTVK